MLPPHIIKQRIDAMPEGPAKQKKLKAFRRNLKLYTLMHLVMLTGMGIMLVIAVVMIVSAHIGRNDTNPLPCPPTEQEEFEYPMIGPMTLLDSYLAGGTIAGELNTNRRGGAMECQECGSVKLSWDDGTRNSGVVEGRLFKHESISGIFILGCDECAATVKVVPAYEVAHYLNTQRIFEVEIAETASTKPEQKEDEQ